MHKPTLLAKITALSSFIILLTGFIAYRSGYLDQYLYSPNGGNSLSAIEKRENNLADTGTNPVDSFRNRVMMSSSKSIVIADYKTNPSITGRDTVRPRWFIADSVMKQYKKDKEQEMLYMSSSKSGAIISPNHPAKKRYLVVVNREYQFFTAYQIDSLLLLQPLMDSLYTKPDTIKTEPIRIYSTKSGSIIRPSDIKSMEKIKKKTKKKLEKQQFKLQ
jgi:hypothetical protein